MRLDTNWRRGLNRIFLLAALAWGIYVVFVYPIRQGRVFDKRFGEFLADCDAVFKQQIEFTQDKARVRQAAQQLADCNDQNWKAYEAYHESLSFLAGLQSNEHAFYYAAGVLTASGEPHIRGNLVRPVHHGFDWEGALILLGLLVLPPALMYGICEIVWRAGRWVVRGFRAS